VEFAPLIVEERVEAFFDAHELGAGPTTFIRIGDGGGSNFTFLVKRGGERFVLRRPPRPPLPPSAHDMVREARLQNAIRAAASRASRRSSPCATTSPSSACRSTSCATSTAT
jgi:aminoglycoside phosphotransferase (APT) family kinase protein